MRLLLQRQQIATEGRLGGGANTGNVDPRLFSVPLECEPKPPKGTLMAERGRTVVAGALQPFERRSKCLCAGPNSADLSRSD